MKKHTIDSLYEFLIGENQNENDTLLSSANQNDLWFHLKSFSSAHGILKTNNETKIPKKIIQQCASLLKENSKQSHLIHLKVIYTCVKNVKKTKIKGQVITKKTKEI